MTQQLKDVFQPLAFFAVVINVLVISAFLNEYTKFCSPDTKCYICHVLTHLQYLHGIVGLVLNIEYIQNQEKEKEDIGWDGE